MTSDLLGLWERLFLAFIRLWQPARQRYHSRLLQAHSSRCHRPGISNNHSLMAHCLNACSANNKVTMLSHLDVIVVTETWHEGPGSTTLTLSGYRCLEAARLIPLGTAADTVHFQNRGGLAIIHQNIIRFQKITLVSWSQSVDIRVHVRLCIHCRQSVHTAPHLLTWKQPANDAKVFRWTVIYFVFVLSKPSITAQWVTSRVWRLLSHDAFALHLEASELCWDLNALTDTPADDLVGLYRGVLTSLLHMHYPAVKMHRRPKKAMRWFDTNCHAARRHKPLRGASDGEKDEFDEVTVQQLAQRN